MPKNIHDMMELNRSIPIELLPKALTLWVKEEDKQIGHPRDGLACTGAVCAKRALGAEGVLLGLRVAYLYADGHLYKGNVSKGLRQNVIIPNDEERYEDILVGPYDITPPTKSERDGAPSKRRKELEKKRAEGKAPPPVSRGTYVTRHFRRI